VESLSQRYPAVASLIPLLCKAEPDVADDADAVFVLALALSAAGGRPEPAVPSAALALWEDHSGLALLSDPEVAATCDEDREALTDLAELAADVLGTALRRALRPARWSPELVSRARATVDCYGVTLRSGTAAGVPALLPVPVPFRTAAVPSARIVFEPNHARVRVVACCALRAGDEITLLRHTPRPTALDFVRSGQTPPAVVPDEQVPLPTPPLGDDALAWAQQHNVQTDGHRLRADSISPHLLASIALALCAPTELHVLPTPDRDFLAAFPASKLQAACEMVAGAADQLAAKLGAAAAQAQSTPVPHAALVAEYLISRRNTAAQSARTARAMIGSLV
jgi:hypothetical protein